MKTIELGAAERSETGKKVKHLRVKGFIPAIVYGRDMKSRPVALNYKDYKKAISGGAGTNVIITLNISDGKNESVPVITHDIQRNPVTDDIIHVDFHKINMREKITTKIPIELAGKPLGVKEEGGILIHSLTELEIKCLPADIPDNLVIDVTPLRLNQGFHVSDVKLMLKEGIEVVTLETENVVTVVPPAKEEVAAPAAVEGAEAAQAEGVPAAEGAAAPAKAEAGKAPAPQKSAEKK